MRAVLGRLARLAAVPAQARRSVLHVVPAAGALLSGCVRWIKAQPRSQSEVFVNAVLFLSSFHRRLRHSPRYHGHPRPGAGGAKKKTGEVAVLQRDDRYIYYLFFIAHFERAHSYFDVLFSRIGCGLDRLDWDKVSAILGEVFEGTDIKITVYTL
ncbi:hypothetical protein ASZ78_001641 [Callipepla squamata]|uniref:Uncharacterized protein n=1 Tax=Callipepla squamata TaxID=9009 RepID=A0A226MIT3_CALSU|nr:hypothetical protein ASZ78_001641 [Callipepla squamata]